MAFFPYVGAGSNVAAGLPSHGYAPPVYDRMLMLIREQTFADKIVSRPPSALMPGTNGTLGYVFTKEPFVRSMPLVAGRDLVTQFPKTEDIFWVPDLAQYVQIGSTRKQRRESRFDLDGINLASGEKSFAATRFEHLLEFMVDGADPLNSGALSTADGLRIGYGGATSGDVLLGTPTRPVVLYPDAIPSGTTAPYASVAVDWVAQIADALSEQVGGDGDTSATYDGASIWDMQRSTQSFLLGGARLNTMCKISNKAISATSQDNFKNALFMEQEFLNAFGVWNRFFKTNFLRPTKLEGSSATGDAVDGTMVHKVIFGQNRAVMASEPYLDQRRLVEDQKNLVQVSGDYWYYGQFLAFPSFLGVGYYTLEDYAVNG